MVPRLRQLVKSAGQTAAQALSRFHPSDVSIFHDFVPSPYGGGNQFLSALRGELARRGWRVENNTLSPVTRACL